MLGDFISLSLPSVCLASSHTIRNSLLSRCGGSWETSVTLMFRGLSGLWLDSIKVVQTEKTSLPPTSSTATCCTLAGQQLGRRVQWWGWEFTSSMNTSTLRRTLKGVTDSCSCCLPAAKRLELWLNSPSGKRIHIHCKSRSNILPLFN